MKTKKTKRSYQMSARAEQVVRNERRILEATLSLWKELPIKEITLEKVAERSGVTVRTVLRKYGSKEGLIEACIENDAGDYDMERDKAPVGDIVGSLKILLNEYEDNGDAVIRTIYAAEEFLPAMKIIEAGRMVHRDWCARVFAPFLPVPVAPEYEARLLAFIAATEIYLWKLLRRDHHQSFDQTFKVFQLLLEGLVEKFQHS